MTDTQGTADRPTCAIDGAYLDPDGSCFICYQQDRDTPEPPVDDDNGWNEVYPAPAPTLLDRLRAQLLDTFGLDNIPEPEPLVNGILYRDSLAWLFGAPGCGKSFVAIDIAGCVATGETWQGNPTARPGPVLYLVAEGASGIRQRVRAWESAMNQQMRGVHFLPVPVQSGVHSQWDALVQLAAELKPALIVIDTQARVTVGMEENSAKEMGEFVAAADRLRRVTRACVLIVHHSGRGGDHMRGSISMEGAANTVVHVTKSEDILTLKCTKQKDAEEFEEFTLRMVPAGASVVLAVTDGRGTARRTGTPRWLVKWWDTHRDDPVSVTTLVDSEVVPKSTFYSLIRPLMDAGTVVRTGTGSATRYALHADPDPE